MKYIQNFLKYRGLLRELVIRDIKIKYRRSILGLLWTVLNPLLMMTIMTLVFSQIFRQQIANFPVYLLCGQLIFNFFSEATNTAMGSVLANAPLIKKIYLPKYLFPIGKVFSSFVNMISAFIALVLVMLVTRSTIYPTALLFFIPISYVLIFAIGMGMFLSTIALFFRDLMHLYTVALTAWIYLTPIFYPIDLLPEPVKSVVALNPLTNIITIFRGYMLNGTLGDPILHVRSLVPGVLMLFIGFYTFFRKQDRFILYI